MSPAPRTGKASLPAEDVLRELRIPFVQRILVEHAGGSEELFTFDLGMRGVFVERAEPLPPGDVRVTFRLPGNEIPVTVSCRPAWWHAPGTKLVSKRLPSGVGLEFRGLSEPDARRVRAHIVEHVQGDPRARRFQRTWPPAPEEGT